MERDEGRGRVAVVTGGASGIGLATAGVLAARGWRVVISDLDADACAAAAGPIKAEPVAFDVVDEAATQAALDAIEARLGPVEALMANAGLIQPGGRPEERPLAEFDRIIAVNLRGVYVSCLAAGTRMARRGAGGIVITGSVTASRTAPLHAYAPSKAAVVHMAACLAAEWGRSGVRVNAVSPGYVATPPLRAAMERGQRDPRLLTEAAALGRMVEPEEVGRGVAFLLSDDAAAITGINLPVDAGWLAGAHLSTYGGVRPAR
ncbi:4-formylbenzenesulfonate dehydrogenase TsaC1/TsaC2 [Methylobacterium crusticola]|uniref:4-formylbenzenesulfonate dehydrogenase TsaC1/TsaC2 n=1 Tax=Methylobacterium crusticola TaxID=1697972 RepID=A0ABQ4R6C1_9HYPH|nr:SDR family oxidoreductase [Methylobacterium crusticola]GJD53236.1 4-formylbenzenesulfonate dehydrogenase TsaC1/TsaC2 [Methylobacterium crusticola]